MTFNTSDAHALLAARFDDYLKQSERGELVCGNFLTPEEAARATVYFKTARASDRVLLFGGYADADRKRIFVLPPYLSDIDGEAFEKVRLYFPEEFGGAVKALLIEGSGYRSLAHKDYMGSLLSLGVERDSLGDIIVQGDSSAIVFCTGKIFGFLLQGIEKIASDKVSVSEFSPPEGFSPVREFKKISSTVASGRLDCVVCALTNLSRERAQTAIRSGLCSVNYIPEVRCDFFIKPPCVISVRGEGKFRVLSFNGETKRGRMRLCAEKYV